MFGPSGFGKTHYLIWMLSFLARKLWIVFSFSKTDACAKAGSGVSKFTPYGFVHDGWDEGVLKEFLELMAQLKQAKEDRGLPIRYSFIVFDDIADEKGFKTSTTLDAFGVKSRHYGTGGALLVQATKFIPTSLRKQFHAVILTQNGSQKEMKTVWEEYGTCFPTFKHFMEYFRAITSPKTAAGLKPGEAAPKSRRFMVIDLTKPNNIEDSVFYTEAPKELPEFRIGPEHFRELSLLCKKDRATKNIFMMPTAEECADEEDDDLLL